MKVELLLTIRLTPESRGEMIDSFAGSYRTLRAEIQEKVDAGTAIEVPSDTQIRWLLMSGRWE